MSANVSEKILDASIRVYQNKPCLSIFWDPENGTRYFFLAQGTFMLHLPQLKSCLISGSSPMEGLGPWDDVDVMTPPLCVTVTNLWHRLRISCTIRIYIYICICICIYTRNAWVLPRRCSIEVSHSQTNDVANYRNSYGENNKGTRDY